jgi:cupredoxin-like protein
MTNVQFGIAEELPTFQIDMKDGAVTPQRLEVPAGRRFLIQITNSGKEPAEFESKDLKKEIGIFPGQKSEMVIKRLDAGEYAFFDDFHPGSAPTILVAK